MSPFSFWESGIDEVIDIVNANMELKKEEMKQKAIMMMVQARQIAEFVVPNDKEEEITQLWDYYPELFATERRFAQKQKEEESIVRAVASRKAFAERHNKKIRGDS